MDFWMSAMYLGAFMLLLAKLIRINVFWAYSCLWAMEHFYCDFTVVLPWFYHGFLFNMFVCCMLCMNSLQDKLTYGYNKSYLTWPDQCTGTDLLNLAKAMNQSNTQLIKNIQHDMPYNYSVKKIVSSITR